jgi:CMP-N-acetylneuraminic acid synthetase
MLIVGTMWARGEGSTLKRKNARKICGKPMIFWALQNALDAGFIDEIFVFTEDPELANVTRDLGCHVIDRPKEMIFYNGGFSNPMEWDQYFKKQMSTLIQTPPDISVGLNCNICLLKSESLRQMYIRLMEDELAEAIFPVVRTEPHLYMENPQTGYLFPIWEDPGLDRQKFPKLYRKIGVTISHYRRSANHAYHRNLHHEVSFEESFDIHSEQDLKLAEFFLSQRLYSSKNVSHIDPKRIHHHSHS